jgi:hypothetical protein
VPGPPAIGPSSTNPRNRGLDVNLVISGAPFRGGREPFGSRGSGAKVCLHQCVNHVSMDVTLLSAPHRTGVYEHS